MDRRPTNSAFTRALKILAIAAVSTGSDCTSCTVPNPNFRYRDAAIDAPVDAKPAPHYQYVLNKLLVPTTASQVGQFSIDLNGDGTADNSIGTAFAALSNFGFDIQTALDKSLLSGGIIILADVETADFNNVDAARIRLFLGDKPTPAACNGPGDVVSCTNAKPATCTGCGHHLINGMLSIAANSPHHPAITGNIAEGTFIGGPGRITILISLSDATPIQFDLVEARIKASGLTESVIGSVAGSTGLPGIILAGALKQDSVDNVIFPGITAQIAETITRECTMPASPPGCGCPSGSAGKGIIDALDKDDNCVVSVSEVKPIAQAVLQPDLTIDGSAAYSFGVRASAAKASFSVAGECGRARPEVLHRSRNALGAIERAFPQHRGPIGDTSPRSLHAATARATAHASTKPKLLTEN